MTQCSDESVRSTSDATPAENFSFDKFTASAVYSLFDAVDSESIVEEFDIGKYSKTHDLDNHIKIAVREGINPSDSLAELDKTTATDAAMEKMAASTFSRYTNDRDSAQSFAPCSSYFIPHNCTISVPSSGNDSTDSHEVWLPLMQQISNSHDQSSPLTSSSETTNKCTRSTPRTAASTTPCRPR